MEMNFNNQFHIKTPAMIRKILKWTGIVLLLIITGLYIVIILNQNKIYYAPYPDIRATNDSAVIARGKELVFGPAHCANCHSPKEMEHRLRKGEEVPL
jgi:hypothetical protein